MTFMIDIINIEEFSRCKFDTEGLDGLFFQLAMVVLGFHLTTQHSSGGRTQVSNLRSLAAFADQFIHWMALSSLNDIE